MPSVNGINNFGKCFCKRVMAFFYEGRVLCLNIYIRGNQSSARINHLQIYSR